MGGPMNTWQEVFHEIFFKLREDGRHGLINAKGIAYRLHRTFNYLSDICRRDRVDPFAVANETLKDIERLSHEDPSTFTTVSSKLFNLLTAGTNWIPIHVDPTLCERVTRPRLFQQTGVLLEDLAGVVKYLATIEADGRYDEGDDPAVADFDLKTGQLVQRLHALQAEVHTRHTERACV